MTKNLLVGQSGGPTCAINASLFGVLHEACKHSDQIGQTYGMINGIEGFIQDKVVNLSEKFDLTGQGERLKVTPAAYLGSCRYKLPEDLEAPIYPELFHKFNLMNIGYVLYIGGNDSMDTVDKLSSYAKKTGSGIRFIGVPKTIDNDLVCTDHTPGFGSAAKFVATSVLEIGLDANVYDKPSVTIIELMGRHAGWLTASSVLARECADCNPALIYLPEVPFDMERFIASVQGKLQEMTNVIVCVSEGINDKDGVFLCEYADAAQTDTFGHKMLTGCGKYLENVVRQKLGVKVRSVELNVSQRCSSVNAARVDLDEAVECGAFGVRQALKGQSGKMIACRRMKGPYTLQYECVDVAQVCNQEKAFPLEWITGNGTDIHPAFVDYVSPLILGDVPLQRRNGLPVFCYLPDDLEDA